MQERAFLDVELKEFLETLTTLTRVKILREEQAVYIGNALNAYESLSEETLEEVVLSAKIDKDNRQIILIS